MSDSTKNDTMRNGAVRDSCNLCGSKNISDWFTISAKPFYNSAKRLRDEYTIAKCNDCELVFVREIPSTSELEDVYAEGYYTGRDRVGYKTYKAPSPLDRAMRWSYRLPSRILRTVKKPKNLISKVIEVSTRRRSRPWPYSLIDTVEEYSPVGSILDVGCATGEFLIAARKNGWQTKGVEFSEYSSKKAREAHDLDVFTGSLQDALRSGALDAKYDVVTLWDTAEHLEDPMAVFKSAWVALKPGGLLFVETLNIDGNIAAEQGTDWHFFRPPKHLFYYSEKTLKEYFARSGYELRKDDEFWKDVVTLAGQKPS